MKGHGVGNNVAGYYPLGLQEAFARGFDTRLNDASDTVKLVLLLGDYLNRHYHNRYHSKAQNLRVLLRRAYDEALRQVDVLLMPTIPFTATEIPPRDAPRSLSIDARAEHAGEYLPVRRLRESGLHRSLRQDQRPSRRHDAGRPALRREHGHPLAAAFEADGDWKSN